MIDRHGADMVFHGHAHHGSPDGKTTAGVPVHNVAMQILQNQAPPAVFRISRCEMKVRLASCASCIVFAAASMIQISAIQASAQSSSDSPAHSMQQDSQPASLASSLNKSETKITGCIRSENGKYVVESSPQKKVFLSGPEDFAPQVGHTVVLYGSYLNATAPANRGKAGPEEALGAPADGQENNFQVSKVEMVSDTCAIK